MPSFLPEVTLDVEHFVNQAVAVGARSLNFLCKNAFGNCFYPSDVEYRNAAVTDEDIAGKVFRLAKIKGLECIAYHNMTLNDELAEEHPEWQQTDVQGKRLKHHGYHKFCMNCSPYRERVYRTLEEMASRFEVDGFFLDLQSFHPQGCFCTWCKEEFRKRYGYPLDVAAFNEMKHWLALQEFQEESRKAFILGAVERCRRIRPNLGFTWNGSGALSPAHVDLDAAASFLTSEAHPPGYMDCSAKAKWMQSSAKPFNLTMPETMQSWGDWTLVNARTLKGMCAIAMAHGGTIEVNHVPMPCGDYAGRVFPAVYDVIGETFRWMKEREPLCADKRTVPVVAVLHSIENVRLSSAFRFREKYGAGPDTCTPDMALGSDNFRFCMRLLNELHMPADALYHDRALDRLDEYEMVVLPNVGYVTEELAERLRRYVAEGGKLAALYYTSLLGREGEELENFSLADMFGVDFVGHSPYSIIYLDRFQPPLKEELPQMPLLIKDSDRGVQPLYHALYCRLRQGAEALAYFTEPVIETDLERGYHVYHDHAPPATVTDIPAIIRNRFGKGSCVFMPFPFLPAYSKYGGPWLRAVFEETLRSVEVPRAAQFRAPTYIQIVLTQDDRRWLLHLINVQREAESVLLEEPGDSTPVDCALAPPRTARSVRNALTGEPIEFSAANGHLRFSVPHVAEHDIVEVSFT